MAPVDSSPQRHIGSNFELVCSLKADNNIPVHKYKSHRTGLTVLIAEVDGPIVNGYFCLATEALDDDGLPHTLEHLVFLGSENYPYKGVLDLLANRCLASGTNAWTDVDHTCYTMTTAGSEGFLSLLPIYLEHILYPTLTSCPPVLSCWLVVILPAQMLCPTRDALLICKDATQIDLQEPEGIVRPLVRNAPNYPKGFFLPGKLWRHKDDGYTTEVHHITAEGEDAGVVYCEMQGRENSGESRVHLAMNRAIYPGECGYKSETGGIMKNLRESTSNAKVRQYHKDFYRPENLTVIITGAIKPVEVFRALEKLEEQIVSKGPRGNYERPWQNPVPPFEKSLEELIEYPCDDEDNGIVNIAWRGPSPRKDNYTLNACALLFKYLTDTAVSPLQKEFVEIDDPFASCVIYSISENSESVLYLTFMNVPTQKVDEVQPKLKKYLELFAEGTERIDMKRMKTVVHRQKLERISSLENSPHDSIAFMVIADVLHGNNVEDLNQRLNYIEHLNRLENEPEEFWLSLLKVYLIDNPEVTIKGIPSIKEQTKMTADEKTRVAKQREALGEDGLKKKAEELKVAMENNEKLPPNEMLTSVPIPSTDSITFHKIVSYTSDSKEKPTNFDIDKMPVYTYLSHVNTNFVYMFVVMDTEALTTEQRNYLPLLFEAFTETSVKRGDKIVPYEDIVAELEADTVAASSRIGLESSSRFTCGPYSTSASLLLQVESDKYERGILWLKELLYDTVFTPERLKIIALKMSNDIPHFKRKGNKIAHDLMKGICYNKSCNVSACNLLKQQKFLTSLIAKLNGKEASTVVDELNTIRDIIGSPKGLALFLAANLNNLSKKYPDPASLWKNFLSSETPFRNKLKVKPDYELMVPFNSPESNKSCIIGLGCVESSFFVQATPSIRDFNHPDLAALMLFMQYLSQLEGPMWRQIRGGGFAYHYNIYTRPNEGLLYLVFFKATNPVGAYKEARKIIESQLNNGEWDPILIESARSSLIFEIIDREKSLGDVVAQSLLSYFKGVDHQYNRRLVSQIGKVSVEDLNRVGRQYVSPLFEPEKTRTTIVCHPSKTGEIAAALKEVNLELTVYPSLEESFLNKW